MNAPITKAELDRLFPPPRSQDAERGAGALCAVLRLRDALDATGLPRLLARAGERLTGRLRRQRTIAALNVLSDRELADIGLRRADLLHVFDEVSAHPAGRAGWGGHRRA